MTQPCARRAVPLATATRKTAKFLACCAVLCCALPLFFPASAFADVPPLLPIQGYLTDKQGTPIDGSKSVSFRLYTVPTGGSPLHEETIQVVAVDGYFTAYLGDDSQHPLDLTRLRDSAKVFLGIEVATDGEGSPRLQIATTAFAAQAAYCGDATNLGGKAPSAFASAVHAHDWSEITGKPDAFPPTSHSHGDADIACYSDLTAEGYLDDNAPEDLLTQQQADSHYAYKSHAHDASEIQSGLLSDQRFSAYADLNAEGLLDNNGGGDVVLQGQGDMRYVNTGEPNSINGSMITDSSVQAPDLAPSSVQMVHTTAPLGASTISQTLPQGTNYLMSSTPAVADSSGNCVISATVRTTSTAVNPTGYFYTYPAYQQGGGPPTSAPGTTIAYGMPVYNQPQYFQTSTITGMLPVNGTPGSPVQYQFGCVVYVSSITGGFNSGFTCNVSWICN